MVAAAWLCESSDSLRLGLSLNPRKDIAVPEGWVFEESLSTKFSFVPTEERDNRLKLIGTEGNLRIYRDSNTGELVYTAHERDNSTLKLESKIMPSTSVSKDAQGRYQIHVSEDSDANSVMSALSYIFADQTQHVQKKPFSKSTKLPLRPSGQAHMHAILHFIHGLSAFIKNKLQRTTANSRNTSRRKRITKPTCAK